MKTERPGRPGERRNAPKDSDRTGSGAGPGRPPRDGRGRPPGRGGPPPRTGNRQPGGRGPVGGTRRPGREARDAAASGPILRGEALYGRNGVAEALSGQRRPFRLLLGEGVQRDARLAAIVSRAEALGVPVDEVPRQMLDDLTRGANHQGVVLDAEGFHYAAFEDLLEREGTLLALDHLQDPQNFGTLMRAAEAAAVAGIILPQNRAVAVTPAVVNASAGAVEHLHVAKVPNLVRALESAKKAGWWTVGLDRTAESVDLFSTDLPTPVALVVGSEGSGIGQHVGRHLDLTVSLPMLGKIDSLNAATAGSIALFDLVRRHQSVASRES